MTRSIARGGKDRGGKDIALVAATVLTVLALQNYFKELRQLQASSFAMGSGHAPFEIAAPTTEHGRGRTAANPLQMPPAGWKDILWRTYERTSADRLLATAAGVVFYGLLAVFPAITALVSSYGLFANPSTISGDLQSLTLMMPEGSFAIVQDQVARVLAKGHAALGMTFLFGLLFAVWSANAGVKAIIDALNVVYGEREKRSFVRLNVLSLMMTSGAILALLVMVSSVVALPLVFNHIGLGHETQMTISLARWPLLLLLLLLALGILYRFGPSRNQAKWQWLSVGSATATFLWIAGSALLSWYLSNFGNYSATYGSLGAVIALMMWMWMSAIIVLFGAELNSEIEHQTAVDTTVGQKMPLGQRGAVMANTVG